MKHRHTNIILSIFSPYFVLKILKIGSQIKIWHPKMILNKDIESKGLESLKILYKMHKTNIK